MNDPPSDLLAAAQAAWHNAYAPYSRFRVGAALRAESGRVFFGANVENGSYGLSRCAEQSAVLAMASAGERLFSEVVVYTASGPPASPCGACRQIMLEFAPSARVWLVNQEGEVKAVSVAELLPGAFRLP
ncbi:cytidine deaminase [soil metagenome]|jgi:cytidine deaminase|nr:cytidine deaminase [Deinococcota bacterium]